MRRHRLHLQFRIRHGCRYDMIQRGVHQAQRSIRRQQTQRPDIQVLRNLARRHVDIRLDVGYNPAYDFSFFPGMFPRYNAGEAPRGTRVNGLLVE